MKDNPFVNSRFYISAREHFGWRFGQVCCVFGALGMLMGLGSIAGTYEMASRSSIIPMIVEVDRTGEIVGTYKVDRSSPVDARIIHSTLANWISAARLVTADVQLQRDAIFKVYACLSMDDAAFAKMNTWLNSSSDASPFSRSQEVTVSTEIQSCIQQSDTTWQVDWLEKTFDRKGALLREERMRALASVEVAPHGASTTEEDIRRNPCGIFIRDFNWGRQGA